MRKVLIWLSFIFIFTIPLNQYLNVRLLLLSMVLSLVVYKSQLFYLALRRSWDLLLYMLLLIIGVFYSDDKIQGLKVVETCFSLVAVPFLFGGLFNSGINLKTSLLATFTIGILVASCLAMIDASINYKHSGAIDDFQYYSLSNVLGLQPTYMAYYVIASITFLVFVLYYSKRFPLFLLTLAVLFLFIILMLTGGKTAFISLILVFSFFLLKYLLDSTSPRKSYTVVLVVLIAFGLITINSLPYFRNVLVENNDLWERSVLWKSAVSANPDPIFGVGTGDYKLVLNEYYTEQQLSEYANLDFNSHNQFIHQYFLNGIFGLFVFMLVIGRPLYLSFKCQNPLGILIIFPFILYGMTEVFLGRYQGVVFFALCHQIAIWQYYLSKENFALGEDYLI